MSRKPKAARKVRPAEPEKPPLAHKPIPPGAEKESPILRGSEVQAQKLVHQVGSPEGAKQLIDVVAHRETINDFREDHFARRFGFNSRRDLLAASKPIADRDGAAWWATRVKDDQWIVWNEQTMSADRTFASLDEATKSLATPGTSEAPGASAFRYKAAPEADFDFSPS